MEKLRVGVSGLHRGLSYINGFKAFEEVEVTAICDVDEEVLNKVGESTGNRRSHRPRTRDGGYCDNALQDRKRSIDKDPSGHAFISPSQSDILFATGDKGLL